MEIGPEYGAVTRDPLSDRYEIALGSPSVSASILLDGKMIAIADCYVAEALADKLHAPHDSLELELMLDQIPRAHSTLQREPQGQAGS
jgi:hypothetical protein